MRLTIERLRTLVLLAAALLVVALAAFLTVGRWKSHLNLIELPKRLGADIKQEAHEIVYTQSRGGHTLFKIRASKEIQLKQSGRVLLHDVHIELYGDDGSHVDTIDGQAFEYDQKQGKAIASGPVAITLSRPGSALSEVAAQAAGRSVDSNLSTAGSLGTAAHSAASGPVHLKTSGLTFDQKTGQASTAERVEFSIAQGSGSATGALFDSGKGQLALDHAVELNLRRGGQSASIRAAHAEFERADLICHLRAAIAVFRDSQAEAGEAQLLFRQDGSVVVLNASNGFKISTRSGAHLSSPKAVLEFDERNQPRRGRMEDGVLLDSAQNGRLAHGSAPTADLAFDTQGQLSHAHLGRGVALHSEQTAAVAGGTGSEHIVRDWRSPVADVDFRAAGQGKAEVAAIRGTEGVLITGQTQRGDGPVLTSRMTADQGTALFGPNQELSEVIGLGRASMEQTSTTGARQTTSGDRLDAHLDAHPDVHGGLSATVAHPEQSPALQIRSATVDGHVFLTDRPADRPGHAPPPILRAFAGHADYQGSAEFLRLTGNPRVEDGNLQLTADRLDVSQSSGDAFAHGNVKATWLDSGKQGSAASPGATLALGGHGPAHAVAAEAQLHRLTGEVTFRGQARLWQQANSVAAPVIVLDRTKQTLAATTSSPSDPVRLILLSAGGPGALAPARKGAPAKDPSVIQVRAGDLQYSDPDRRAILHGGALGKVFAATESVASSSSELQLQLLPARSGGASQVDKLTARGHVVLDSAGRRGTGEQLVYSAQSGTYVLTGTSADPPRIVDPARGTVTGGALIFNTHDDSVSVEGEGRRTETVTTVPK